MIHKTLKIVMISAIGVFSGAASADQFPVKPITIVVPFAPGGGVDTVARLIGPEMAKKLGEAVVIDNRAGAAGQIGADYVARRADSDGYTLLMGSPGAITAGAALNPDLPYAPLVDLMPVSQAVMIPNLLVARKDFPANNAKEFIEFAKKGNEISYGSGGVGTSQHLAGELLAKTIGSNLLHIPYKGTAPSLSAVVAGQVDLSIADPSAAQYVQAGKIKLLGVTTGKRSKALPEYPTLDEEGVVGYDAGNWYGIFVPKNTPENRIEILKEAIHYALSQKSVQDKLLAMGMDPSPSNPDEFRKYLAQDMALWKKLVDDIGLKLK